jgi:hypothetical protein
MRNQYNLTSEYIIGCYTENPSYFYRKIKREHPEDYALLEKEFKKPVEGLFVIAYGDHHACICGNNTKFLSFRDGFQKYCSHVCFSNATGPKENRLKTNMLKYGVSNPSQNQNIKDKIRFTNNEKYGIDNVFQNKEIQEKTKKAMIDKYGVEYSMQNEALLSKSQNSFSKHDIYEIRAKAKATMLARYGVEHPMHDSQIREKVIKSLHEYFSSPEYLSIAEISSKNKKKMFLEKLIIRAKEYNIKPLFTENEYTCVQDYHVWQCLVCGDTFSGHLDNGILPKCKSCYPVYDSASKGESELRDFISSISEESIEIDSKLISPKKLDIFLPTAKLAFEYNGIYWHSERKVEKTYHLDKTNACLNKNVRLVHIFENEWLYQQEKVKSRICSLLGKNERIFARKCEIIILSFNDYSRFMEKNHIQGSCPVKVSYGLAYNGKIVAAMGFGQSRFDKNSQWELLRFANILNVNVIGGASKLFSRFIKDHTPSNIISYSDKRWNSGSLYNKLGFKFSHSSAPNFFYTKDGITLEGRIKYQKHKLPSVLENYDPSLTALDNMHDNGFYRIFDCGNDVYKWLSP